MLDYVYGEIDVNKISGTGRMLFLDLQMECLFVLSCTIKLKPEKQSIHTVQNNSWLHSVILICQECSILDLILPA